MKPLLPAAGLLWLCGLLLAAPALAQSRSDAFLIGQHYHPLPVPTATATEGITHGGPLLQQLFSYACIDCRPGAEDWTHGLPPDLRVERVPAVFSESWLLLARAYYVAEVCAVLPHTHEAMFEAIHDQGRQFRDAAEIAAFYAQRVHGQGRGPRCRSRDDFLAAFDSLEVAASVQQALALGRVWQIERLPTLVVAGRWRTDPNLAGSEVVMGEVARQLLRRAEAEALAARDDRDPVAGD